MGTGWRFALVLIVGGIAWSLTLACKGSDSNDCGAPDHVTYTCAAQSPDLPGCPSDDGGASYPEGCQKTLPECLCCYPGPEICYCNREGNTLPDGGAGLTWGCPI